MMTKKAKLVTSFAIWYGTFTLGLGVSFLGASLLEISKKFETDVATVSRVFSVLTISFLGGALICGFLFNHLNRQILSSILLMVMGIGTACYPLAPSLSIFYGIGALVGFSGAGYDTAQIVWIIEMWASEAAPYIQVQHFAFALGALASPLLMKPFLSSDVADTIGNATLSNGTLLTLGENYSSQLYMPFLTGGAITVLAGLVLLILSCVMKYEPAQKDPQDVAKVAGSKFHRGLLILLSGLFLGGYCGMEMCSIQFLPSYTHFIPLHLSAADGALILSGLTGSYTVGRGLGIFLVTKIAPETLLLANLILITAGNCVLFWFGADSKAWLWTGAILLGTGFSTVFASFYGYIEKHLEVSNLVGAIMIMAGGVVSSLYPIVIGSHIERDPIVLLYTNYFSLVVCGVVFIGIYWRTRAGSKREEYSLGEEVGGENETKLK